MAEFLTTSGVVFHVEKIITGARENLVLISPFLRFSKTLTERLREADARGVNMSLVYGKRALDRDAQICLAPLKRLALYFFENLHAKCYFNEFSMIITSMNLYEHSEKTNREMGILLGATEGAFRHGVREAKSIIASATRHNIATPGASLSRAARDTHVLRVTQSSSLRSGCCIRCARKLPWNPESPLCRSCFSVWAQFEDPDYEEEVCHTCGRRSPTSLRKPECYSCFR